MAVAQLVESRIVIPVVVGSSPISHPKELAVKSKGYTLRLVAFFVFLEDDLRFLEDPCGNRPKIGSGVYAEGVDAPSSLHSN